MNISFRMDEEFGILSFEGNLEKLSPEKLRGHLEEIADKKASFIVLDISEVEDISTSGLGMIFTGKNLMEDQGIFCVFVGQTQRLRTLIPKMRVERMIPIAESIGKAKIALRRLAFEHRKKERLRKRSGKGGDSVS